MKHTCVIMDMIDKNMLFYGIIQSFIAIKYEPMLYYVSAFT